MIQLCAGSVACINHLTQRLTKWGWFGLDFFGGRGVGFGGGGGLEQVLFAMNFFSCSLY